MNQMRVRDMRKVTSFYYHLRKILCSLILTVIVSDICVGQSGNPSTGSAPSSTSTASTPVPISIKPIGTVDNKCPNSDSFVDAIVEGGTPPFAYVLKNAGVQT